VIAGLTPPARPANISGHTSIAMQEPILFLDPEVKPPEFRVPRGRSGVGAQSALETLLSDLERIRKAKEAYAQLFQDIEQAVLRH
jgi:hypothetical protein